jgi:hypothetical protein
VEVLLTEAASAKFQLQLVTVPFLKEKASIKIKGN